MTEDALTEQEARRHRLIALGLTPSLGTLQHPCSALAVTQRLGALQAQDHASGAWSLGVRSGLTNADVDRAVRDRAVVRTWPMRGTIHWVPARDARWMCRLTGLRALAAIRARFAQLGMTEAMVQRAGALFAEHLTAPTSRPDVFALLEAAGLDTSGQRGYHYVSHHCMTGLLCQGPLAGKQHSFVLIDSWVPLQHKVSDDDARDLIVERYVRGHGPVTDRDIAGWLGHTLGFVRAALESLGERVVRVSVAGVGQVVHRDTLDAAHSRPRTPDVLLLPQWDEYLLGYKNRGLFLPAGFASAVVPGRNMVFQPTLVIDGVVAGTWRRELKRDRVLIDVRPLRPLTRGERRHVNRAAQTYGTFVGVDSVLTVDRGA